MSLLPYINQIICGDALSVLKTLPDECVQMSMCSPPYYGLRDYKVENQIGLEKSPQEYLQKLWAIFNEIKRVLKKDGVIFVNMGDTYGGNKVGKTDKKVSDYLKEQQIGIIKKVPGFEKCLLMIPERFTLGMIERNWILRNRICWYKRNAMPSSVKDRFTCVWEYVYFFSKSRRYYFDLDSVRQPIKFIPGPNDTALSRGRLKPGNKLFNYRVRDAEKKSAQCPQFKASEEEILLYSHPIKIIDKNLLISCDICKEKDVYYFAEDWKKVIPLEYEKKYLCIKCYTKFRNKIKIKDKGIAEIKNLHGECEEQGRRIQIGLRTKIPQETAEIFGSTRARNYRNKTSDQSYKVGGMKPCPEPNDPKYKWHPEKYGEDDPQNARRGRIVPEKSVYHSSMLKNPGDHWDITTRGFKGAHFAVYPEKLCEIPIKAGSRPGDIVLDTFAGSCTTGVMAKKLKRKYIMIDLNSEYCKMGQKRLDNTIEPML